MPNVVVIGGPNGAGKSTAAPMLVHGLCQIDDFVNADVIARGLSAFDPESASIAAGRVMLERLRELADHGADFAFETTLASRSFAPWIAGLIASGYVFRLSYIWVPSADVSINRVASRVAAGGHHVADDVVRRRYLGGLRNFFGLYRPMAHTWLVYQNPSGRPFRLVAEGHRTETSVVYDGTAWQTIQELAEHGDRREV
jgi:predicted ABC-type ATPase